MRQKESIKVKNGILALISACGIIYYLGISTGDILGIILALILFGAYQKYGFKGGKREYIFAAIMSSIFAAIMTLGKLGKNSLSIRDALNLNCDTVYKNSSYSDIQIMGYTSIVDKLMLVVCFVGLFITAFFLLLRVVCYINDSEQKCCKAVGWSTRKVFAVSFLTIFVMWIPYFVINYPGVLVYDSINQLSQVVEGGQVLSNHPPIHTMLIGLCYDIVTALGGKPNTYAALYTVIQMLIMAAIEGNAVRAVYKYTSSSKIAVLVWGYFSIVPFNAMYSITMWKDTLFAGFTLWVVTVIYEIVHETEKISWKLWGQFIISCTLMILFRVNGRIAYVICIPFLIYGITKVIKRNIILVLAPLLISVVISGPIYDLCGVKDTGNIVESLSIPLQHMARVVYDCDDLDSEDVALLEELAPLNEIRDTYNCRFADPMKQLMWAYSSEEVLEENKWEYLLLWARLGLQHPLEYILAELDMTVGYWYSAIQYNVIAVGVYPNDYGIYTVMDTSGMLYGGMCRWTNLYRYAPFIGNLYSMGTMFSLMLFVMGINWYTHNGRRNIVILPVLGILLTIMLATPLFAEMRYMYSMMVSIPVILAMLIRNNKMVAIINEE